MLELNTREMGFANYDSVGNFEMNPLSESLSHGVTLRSETLNEPI